MNKNFAAAVLHYFAMATSRASLRVRIKGDNNLMYSTVTHESILYVIVVFSTDVGEAETSWKENLFAFVQYEMLFRVAATNRCCCCQQ